MAVLENLRLVFSSFGYKYGQPPDAHFLLDVRGLPNPYWVKELRPHTGLIDRVANYVLASKAGREMRIELERFLYFWVEQQRKTDKQLLQIAIGCTGGRHRSVALVEDLADFFEKKGYRVERCHRDIEKDSEFSVS